MQCHALSLANAGARVVVVAHSGSAARARVTGHSNVVVVTLAAPAPPDWLPTLAALPLKALLGALELARALFLRVPRADTMLVQNPPAIPALVVALAACAVRGSRLVIDWHNFGYTVLRVSLLARRGLPASGRLRGGAAALVLIAKAYERLVCRFAHAHLCVSDAMAAELAAHWHVRATVLHDRPDAAFAPLGVADRHALLSHLQPSLLARMHPPVPAVPGELAEGTRTFATERCGPKAAPALRADRPALVLTGTSWGADEDYSILIRALALLDGLPQLAVDGRTRPRLVVIVTGDGPLRAAFEADMCALSLRRVHVGTAWLSADDYPRLLGCADLGICLHASTSAVDLPMKVRTATASNRSRSSSLSVGSPI
jgi:beta-1,4-mannosyltransferase